MCQCACDDSERDSAVNCELWSPLSACITCFQPKLTLMKHIFRIVYSFFTNRKLEYLFNIFLCNILNYYFAWLIVNQALGKIKTKYNVILSPSVYYILLYSIQHLIPIQKSFNAKLEWILWQQFNPRLLKRIINHCLPVLLPWKMLELIFEWQLCRKPKVFRVSAKMTKNFLSGYTFATLMAVLST